VKVAIIGAGKITQKTYLPLLSARNDLELYLYSRDAQKLERIQRQFRLAGASNELDVVRHWEPQVAFILTVPGVHYGHVKTFLELGCDVFVEKPAALFTWQIQELAELAEAKKALLMVGFNRRYAPLNQLALNTWAARDIQMAIFEKHRFKAYHPDLYTNFVDDTIHIVDLLRFLCGEAEALYSIAQESNGFFWGGMVVLTLKKGGQAMIATSLQAGRWTEKIALHGESASLHLEMFTQLSLMDNEKMQLWQESPTSAALTTNDIRGFSAEIEHFFDCIQTHQQPLSSAIDAIKTHQLIDQIAQVTIKN
jgi:virulence factor